MSEYTLNSRNYKSFLKGIDDLFLKNLKSVIDDMGLKETYDVISDAIEEYRDNEEVVRTLYKGDKALVFYGEREHEEVLINCKKCNDENILNILNVESDVYSIYVNETLCYRYLSVYFDEAGENIMFSYSFLDEHKYLLLRNFEIVTDTFNDYEYILWIITFIGDILYDFSDED